MQKAASGAMCAADGKDANLRKHCARQLDLQEIMHFNIHA
jgi:hypothetical protein